MDLLFVTGSLPYPPTDGWRIRVFALLRALAERHRVTVVSFFRPVDEALAADRLREYGVDLHVIPRSPSYPVSKLVRGLISSEAFPIINYADDRLMRKVRELVVRRGFDVVQAESLHMAQYCLDLGLPSILDLHNIESLLMKRYARRASNPLKRLYAELTWRKLARYEREVCPRFSHCLTCSDEERILLQTCAGVERVTVIPNGVHAATYGAGDQTANPAADPPRLVFVGRMDYHANVDGVQWFCRHVLPRIRAARPDVVLQVVGGHPVPEISRLAHPGLIEVTGFVTDVKPYISSAAVVVVPLRVGGGTRLKILESLAMGKAIVSTSLGAEGIEAVPGRDLLIADDPDAFSQQVLTLLSDQAQRAQLGSAGRRLAATKYDWDTIVKNLELIYEWCLGSKTRFRSRAQPVA